MTGCRTAPAVRALWALAAVAAFAIGGVACDRRPALFADCAPVWDEEDDAPVPLPRARKLISGLYYSNAYVRQRAVDLLDPTRTPEAADVNAMDEVPRSSWFEPDRRGLEGYRRDGPPVLPLRLLATEGTSGLSDARCAVDARGLAYELVPDSPRRPELRTAALAVASRLVWALGYRSAEVWMTRDERGGRVAALRWPVGIDLGVTSGSFHRPDDPNDVLPHRDRRSLRALGAVMAWLGQGRLAPGALRDAYQGPPGRGHVEHFVVGLDGALGASAQRALDDAARADEPSGSALHSLVTLGLWPAATPEPTSAAWPASAVFGAEVEPGAWRPRPPFEPVDRVTAPDLYWMAKRVASVAPAVVKAAVADGELSTHAARDYVEGAVEARRRQVVHVGYAGTTPCELDAVKGRHLTLLDRAISEGYADATSTTYEVEWVDGEGDAIATPTVALPAPGARVELDAPETPTSPLVLRVWAVRAGERAPRSVDIHWVSGAASGGRGLAPLSAVGVRH